MHANTQHSTGIRGAQCSAGFNRVNYAAADNLETTIEYAEKSNAARHFCARV